MSRREKSPTNTSMSGSSRISFVSIRYTRPHLWRDPFSFLRHILRDEEIHKREICEAILWHCLCAAVSQWNEIFLPRSRCVGSAMITMIKATILSDFRCSSSRISFSLHRPNSKCRYRRQITNRDATPCTVCEMHELFSKAASVYCVEMCRTRPVSGNVAERTWPRYLSLR